MIGKHKKKTFNLILVFALIFSLFTPFSANVSKAAEIISVAEAIANNSGTATVEGYIVGYNSIRKWRKCFVFTYCSIYLQLLQIWPSLIHQMRQILVKFCPCNYPLDLIRTELNLIDHPENLGKKIQITGSLEAYFSVPGFKEPKWIYLC